MRLGCAGSIEITTECEPTWRIERRMCKSKADASKISKLTGSWAYWRRRRIPRPWGLRFKSWRIRYLISRNISATRSFCSRTRCDSLKRKGINLKSSSSRWNSKSLELRRLRKVAQSKPQPTFSISVARIRWRRWQWSRLLSMSLYPAARLDQKQYLCHRRLALLLDHRQVDGLIDLVDLCLLFQDLPNLFQKTIILRIQRLVRWNSFRLRVRISRQLLKRNLLLKKNPLLSSSKNSSRRWGKRPRKESNANQVQAWLGPKSRERARWRTPLRLDPW